MVREYIEESHPLDGIHRHYHFPNGYIASVIKNKYSYGGDKGLWEVAVCTSDAIVYDTPVTNDVIGWLDDEGLEKVLTQIEALPPRAMTLADFREKVDA